MSSVHHAVRCCWPQPRLELSSSWKRSILWQANIWLRNSSRWFTTRGEESPTGPLTNRIISDQSSAHTPNIRWQRTDYHRQSRNCHLSRRQIRCRRQTLSKGVGRSHESQRSFAFRHGISVLSVSLLIRAHHLLWLHWEIKGSDWIHSEGLSTVGSLFDSQWRLYLWQRIDCSWLVLRFIGGILPFNGSNRCGNIPQTHCLGQSSVTVAVLQCWEGGWRYWIEGHVGEETSAKLLA